MSMKKVLPMLLERDNYKCGIHYGGCGQDIKQEDIVAGNVNVDHIIPKTLFKHKVNQGASVFMQDYFRQPTHVSCNAIDKRGQLTAYPEFSCDCHYTYYNVETDTVELYFQHFFKHNNTFEWRKEVFVKNFINHNKDGIGHIMKIGNRGDWYGFSRDKVREMGSIFKQYKYADLYICYLINIFSLLKCKRVDKAKQEYGKYLGFLETEDSYSRPDTLDKVSKMFEDISDKDDTTELANEILYIINPKTYYLRAGQQKCQSENKDDIAKGIEFFHKSIKLGADKEPNIASIYNSLGYAYGCIDNWEEAEKNLLKSIELDSSIKQARGNLSRLYQDKGLRLLEDKEYEEALEYFLKAKELMPILDINYNLIAHTSLCIDDTDTKTALKYINEGLDVSPESESLKENLQMLKDQILEGN